MLGEILMQVSINDFQAHNTKTADISKAFVKGFSKDPSRNQIERICDDLFDAKHTAVLLRNGKFEVKRNGKSLTGFRIVCFRGSPRRPTHSRLVKRFPYVAHVI
jgi:hypothetical protein